MKDLCWRSFHLPKLSRVQDISDIDQSHLIKMLEDSTITSKFHFKLHLLEHLYIMSIPEHVWIDFQILQRRYQLDPDRYESASTLIDVDFLIVLLVAENLIY